MFKVRLSIINVFVLMAVVPLMSQAQLDDPTRPPGYRLALPNGEKVVTRYIVSSVRLSATRRSAIINDKSVEAGDTVNGARVIAIYPSAVKLKKQGRVFTIRVFSRIAKKNRIQ